MRKLEAYATSSLVLIARSKYSVTMQIGRTVLFTTIDGFVGQSLGLPIPTTASGALAPQFSTRGASRSSKDPPNP